MKKILPLVVLAYSLLSGGCALALSPASFLPLLLLKNDTDKNPPMAQSQAIASQGAPLADTQAPDKAKS